MTSKTQISSKVMASLLLVFGLVFSNCSDSNPAPIGNETETVVSDTRAKKGGVPAGLIPNSQRYNNSSMPSASGRDGDVTVTARAMIDVDGNTLLEVTTASLDGDNRAPGTITKQQVKALDLENPDKDNPVWVENYNRLRNGGYFSENYTGLVRGQQLALHTNVKGIIRGTAVVFIDETIKARPDIQVTEVATSADEILVDEVVTITAGLTEANGDLGATTSCVLYIDGEEVDRANNVWVDAGDLVGCQFTTSFSEVGEKHILVTAEDVIPGDYDGSNNSAYTTVNVIEPETGGPNGFTWSAGIFMSNDSYYERRYSATHYEVRENKSYLIFFNGYKDLPADFVMPDSFNAKIITNGETAFDVNLALLNGRFYDWQTGFNVGIGTWSNRLNYNFYFNSYRYVYYGSNEFQGDFYNENSTGPDFDLGDDISFEFEFGGHTASGTFDINSYSYGSRNDYGPDNYQIYRSTSYSGWGSGQPEYEEVGAESADVEGEEDVEE